MTKHWELLRFLRSVNQLSNYKNIAKAKAIEKQNRERGGKK